MRPILSALLLVLAFCPARAEPTAMMGFGTVTCAHFAEDYRKKPDVTELLYFEWAQGYMSGQNVAFADAKRAARNLGGTSTISQRAMLRSYCDAHPLSFFWIAVMALYETLPVAPTE